VGASAAAFFLACVLRLVRFEILSGGKRSDFFVGFSAPAAAVIVTLAVYLGMPSRDVLVITGVAALLMVSRIRYPKIRGALAPPSLLALLATLAFGARWDAAMPKLLLSLMTVYAIVGPLFVRWRAGRTDDYELVNA
jgi:phosphatidylserine synthase